MANIYIKRIKRLCDYLDGLPDDEILPSVLTFCSEGMIDGKRTEVHLVDYGAQLRMSEAFSADWMETASTWVLKRKPTSPNFICILEFFDLSPEQYFHVFVSYYQNLEKYGGQIIMHEGTKPKDLSFNLRQLLDRRLPF